MILVLIWGGAMAQAPYCTPTYSTGCTYGDGITLFQLGTINQAIGCNGATQFMVSRLYSAYHDHDYRKQLHPDRSAGYAGNLYECVD